VRLKPFGPVVVKVDVSHAALLARVG
jgi:hypothetical protein